MSQGNGKVYVSLCTQLAAFFWLGGRTVSEVDTGQRQRSFSLRGDKSRARGERLGHPVLLHTLWTEASLCAGHTATPAFVHDHLRILLYGAHFSSGYLRVASNV